MRKRGASLPRPGPIRTVLVRYCGRDHGWRVQDRHKQTPVLIPDEAMPLADILARFAAESAALPPALRQLVQQQLTTAGN